MKCYLNTLYVPRAKCVYLNFNQTRENVYIVFLFEDLVNFKREVIKTNHIKKCLQA